MISTIVLFSSLFASILAQESLPSTKVSTCGWFFGTSGGQSVRYCGTSCSQSSAPSRLVPRCPPQTGDPVDTQARWGKSVTSGNPYAQSGMGFTGEALKTVPLNREWYCGRLTHFNHPIIGPASFTRLGIQLLIPEFKVDQTFSFKLDIDETTNNEVQRKCPYPSTVPCSDKITFDLAGLDIGKNFEINGVEYTLQLTGFKESRVSTSFPTQNFISNEQRENNAFLFGRIVAGCPSTCPNNGKVELQVVNGVKTCGCNCSAVSCNAPQILQKDCSCKCPVGTCNGGPTKPGTCDCNCPTPASANQVCNQGKKTAWDSATCQCKCPDTVCGAAGGVLRDAASCQCDCAQVTCQNGRVPNPENQCQCECLAECGPKQIKIDEAPNGKCGCVCDPMKTECAVGFKLEIDPTNPSVCRCGCANVCGAGCASAGSAKQCNDGPTQPCCEQCQFRPKACDDNNKCTKDDVCRVDESIQGKTSVCRGESRCPVPKDTCTYYECDPKVGNCDKKTVENGKACGLAGSDPNTWDLCKARCVDGECQFRETSCDAQATAMGMMLKEIDPSSCEDYGCNPKNGLCELGPKPGKTCNDGNGCTVNDICQADPTGALVCTGEAKVCTDEPQACHEFECNPKLGVCVAVPSKYGTACFGDGTNNCQGEGVCSGGVCLFKRKCAALTGDDALCNTNECDPMSGKCSLVPRLDGAACVLPNGRPKGEDFCLGNYTCHLALVGGTQKGVCDGQQLEATKNHSACAPPVIIETGAGADAALVVGLAALGAAVVMILVAVLLCAFVNKSALTDPSTWGMGADAAVENSPLYDESAGGQVNQLYEG